MKTLIFCINHRANPNQPSCGARGGIEIADLAEAEATRLGLNIRVERFKCLGLCECGPNAKIVPDGEFIHALNPDDVTDLLQRVAAAPPH